MRMEDGSFLVTRRLKHVGIASLMMLDRLAVQSKSPSLPARSSHGRKEHGKDSKKVDDVNRMVERMDEDFGSAAPGLRRFDLRARQPRRGKPIGEQSRRKSDPHGTARACRRGVHAGRGTDLVVGH